MTSGFSGGRRPAAKYCIRVLRQEAWRLPRELKSVARVQLASAMVTKVVTIEGYEGF